MKAGDKAYWVVGLMSGTSLDGVDAAMLFTDGVDVLDFGPTCFIPYGPELRADIASLCVHAMAVSDKTQLPPFADDVLRRVELALTEAHVDAVASVLEESPTPPELIGFHGQTIAHRPDLGWTWQIGDAGFMARACGLPVVHDFRSADMVNAGEGAPFAPLYHQALLRRAEVNLPVAVVNIGGVANISWVSEERVIACDTGPGGALLDDFIQERTGMPFDVDGGIAARGTPVETLLGKWLAHPFYGRAAPKSLDRGDMAVELTADISTSDGAASLAALTARSIAAARDILPTAPKAWYVTGGGRKNRTVMAMLEEAARAPVHRVEELGWNGDFLEAQLFAYLAARSVRAMPLSLPDTTGCNMPTTGGILVSPS